MENSNGNTDKKSATSKNDKTRKKSWTMLGQKGKIAA